MGGNEVGMGGNGWARVVTGWERYLMRISLHAGLIVSCEQTQDEYHAGVAARRKILADAGMWQENFTKSEFWARWEAESERRGEQARRWEAFQTEMNAAFVERMLNQVRGLASAEPRDSCTDAAKEWLQKLIDLATATDLRDDVPTDGVAPEQRYMLVRLLVFAYGLYAQSRLH